MSLDQFTTSPQISDENLLGITYISQSINLRYVGCGKGRVDSKNTETLFSNQKFYFSLNICSVSHIKVRTIFYRIRPQIPRELIDMCRMCTTVTPNEPQIILGADKAFTFDYVYDTFVQQAEVYNSAVDRLVEGSLKGYNATVLAYGQVESINRKNRVKTSICQFLFS